MVENKQHAPAQMKREKEKNKITWILITAEAEIITREKQTRKLSVAAKCYRGCQQIVFVPCWLQIISGGGGVLENEE